MLNFTIEQEGIAGTLAVEGEITIVRANELRTALLNSLDKVNHVAVNFEKATAVDLTCLQLLYSAYQTARKNNKNLTLRRCSEAFKRAVADAGAAIYEWLCLGCENNCSVAAGG